jgi:Cu(I)/Ag(I) efflux system membrane fusion protein
MPFLDFTCGGNSKVFAKTRKTFGYTRRVTLNTYGPSFMRYQVGAPVRLRPRAKFDARCYSGRDAIKGSYPSRLLVIGGKGFASWHPTCFSEVQIQRSGPTIHAISATGAQNTCGALAKADIVMSKVIDSRWARFRQSYLKAWTKPVVLIIFVAGIAFGYWIGHRPSEPIPEAGTEHSAHGQETEMNVQFWTCAMHPQIRQPQPGKCPLCGMELIPVSEDSGSEMAGLRQYRTSEAAKQLMNIETSLVERKFVTKEVRMVGKADYDETRLSYITAWIPGRIDQLYVDYTGIEVREGDHMVYLYSPELLTAQEELRRTAQAIKDMRPGAPDVLRETAQATVEAARDKLRRWGLTDEQIADAEESGITSDHVTIYAPISGTVIHRNGQEGMYVQEGTRIYTLADLSSVWVKLDAYESDLSWLHYGQRVSFTTEAYPGEEFEGRISFIDPVLDPMTRTVKVRVNVSNPDGRLKPEMFVRSLVRAQVATGGRVMDPSLAGKWIGPMHPEVIKNGPGTCDVCGMQLVRAEDMGYVSAQPKDEDMPLVIPASAALVTGTRAIVYVELPNEEVPTYEGREIVLGPRAGEYYLVRAGLNEGDRVVTRGNFKIDSALQILAKPSMMTPDGGGGGGGHQHGGSTTAPGKDQDMSGMQLSPLAIDQITALEAAQSVLSEAIAGGDSAVIQNAIEGMESSFNAVDMALMTGHMHMTWMEYAMRLRNDLVEIKEAKSNDELASLVDGMAQNLALVHEKLGIKMAVEAPFTAPQYDAPETFNDQIAALSETYLDITSALAEDDEAAARNAVERTLTSLEEMPGQLLAGEAESAWVEQSTKMGEWLKAMKDADGIDKMRLSLDSLTDALANTLEVFGVTPDPPIYEAHCPMALDGEGAEWLQRGTEVRNPYFGQSMLSCGEVVRQVGARQAGTSEMPDMAHGDEQKESATMTHTGDPAGDRSHE